jgi:hypothetical protein
VFIPHTIAELNPGVLTALIADMHPGASVVDFEVLDIKKLGPLVSTAGRAKLRLKYGPGSPKLPEQVILKMIIDEPGVPSVLYETEVMVHRKFLPELKIEKAVCLAAQFDPKTERFILILEDLTVRGATFPNVTTPPLTPKQVATCFDLLATLHAQYWNSPRLNQEKEWLSSLTEGRQYDFFASDTVAWIDDLVANSPYRADLITRCGRNPARLWENVKAVQRYHQEMFPPTLQHGDTGAHNTYHLPDGSAGFLDWQLAVRSAWPRDIHYLLCTGLSTADRRAHDRALVGRYLGRLSALGVRDVPGIDVAMREVGRSLIWGFTIGWLMVPPRNYGMDIISANLERLYAAVCDYNTFALADQVTP